MSKTDEPQKMQRGTCIDTAQGVNQRIHTKIEGKTNSLTWKSKINVKLKDKIGTK